MESAWAMFDNVFKELKQTYRIEMSSIFDGGVYKYYIDKLTNEGYDIYRELLGTYHYCKENGNWYGYEGITGYPDTLVGECEFND